MAGYLSPYAYTPAGPTCASPGIQPKDLDLSLPKPLDVESGASSCQKLERLAWEEKEKPQQPVGGLDLSP